MFSCTGVQIGGHPPVRIPSSRYKQHALFPHPSRNRQRSAKLGMECANWVFPAFLALSTAAWFCLVLLEVDKSGRQPCPVGDASEQQFGSLYNSSSKHLLSDHENVRNIRYAQEVIHIVEAVGLSVSIRQCGINRWLAEGLTRRTRSLCLSA